LVSGKFPLWVGGFLSLFFSKPIVAIIHGSEVQLSNSLAKNLTNWSLSRFDSVIAVSKFTLNLVKAVNLKSSVVIPNGFDLPNSAKDICKLDTSTMDEAKLNLITVGNLTQRKGQHNVITALPLLLKTYPKLKYHCIGIPTDKEKLLALAESLRVAHHVVFHGRVSETQKFKLLQESDLFIMLSEQTPTGDVEGFGIAILEANAVGLPAIGSINCGIEDAIKSGYSGELVDPHDNKDIKANLMKIIKNKDIYSYRAQDWSSKFSWNKIGDKYLKLIENLLIF
jgi:glycosyltransferase involved in cell wall biosynthesis